MYQRSVTETQTFTSWPDLHRQTDTSHGIITTGLLLPRHTARYNVTSVLQYDLHVLIMSVFGILLSLCLFSNHVYYHYNYVMPQWDHDWKVEDCIISKRLMREREREREREGGRERGSNSLLPMLLPIDFNCKAVSLESI